MSSLESGRRVVTDLRRGLDAERAGRELYDRLSRLFPICRSITGDGVRETLRLIGQEIAVTTRELPTGTHVFDWTIPQEWNIRDAYIKDRRGRRVVDFAASNLHVVSYSTPVHTVVTRSELDNHLFSIPERPDWIPYKTSYYTPSWGFCLTQRQRDALTDAEYEVCIDSTLADGHLTLGECVLPGREPHEVLFSCHICHPSLCNDNLSGVTVAVTLAKLLATVSLRYSYRFLFIPGTIGAIAWLALNEATAVPQIKHGLVLACLGDRGHSTYKRSRIGNAEIDRAVAHVLTSARGACEMHEFSPYGYDERQYCSPAFNLPVGVLSRTPHGRFPEYHTSADNLEFVTPEGLADSLEKCLAVVEILEGNRTYINRLPKCEPQLGKRGLYGAVGGHGGTRAAEEAMLWILNLSDGDHSLLDITERSRLRFDDIQRAATILHEHELLRTLHAQATLTR
jgi:aminopeptidase-like protein